MRHLPLATLATLTTILITGCGSFAALSVGAGAMPVTKRPQYDSPQQVIYRLDEHRYITLENYKDCEVGGIMKWHDETRGIHEVVEEHPTWGSGVWPGRFAMEPGGEHLMIPTYGCGDRSCNLFINYSNDGGRTWSYFGSWSYSMWAYRETDSDYQVVRQTTVRVTKDGYAYITKPNYSTVARYHNGVRGAALTEERCYPPSFGMTLRRHMHIGMSAPSSRPNAKKIEQERPPSPLYPKVVTTATISVQFLTCAPPLARIASPVTRP